MCLKIINPKRITFALIVISLINVALLAFAESWYQVDYLRKLFDEFVVHVTFIFVMSVIFYYAASSVKSLWITKYILSGFIFVLWVAYNLGAIQVIISDSHDLPYSIAVLLCMFFITPVLAFFMAIAAFERYLKIQ
jgi:hypothetical protein